MRIYYNKNTEELLTEDEAYEEIDNTIYGWRFKILLKRYTDSEIWDMLKEDIQLKLYEEMKDEILKEDYYYRDFDE